MNSIGYSDQQSSAAYRAAVMSGATGQVEGYTAAPASDQQQQQQQGDDVGYDYGQPSHADPRRG